MARPDWLEALWNRRMLICIFTGFSSGLPYSLLISLIPIWLRDEGISLAAIGMLTITQLPYAWKFLWSPFLDRYPLPWLGRRRGWMAVTQLILLGGIFYCGQIMPQGLVAPAIEWQTFLGLRIIPHPHWDTVAAFATHPVTLTCLFITLISATQDIALDAYRRELLPDHELGLGNSTHVSVYRIAGLVPGSLSLILADHLSWNEVFAINALFMLPGFIMTLLVSEKAGNGSGPRTLREAIVEPFREFLTRVGWHDALLILIFIFFYKLGDSLCTAQASVFYRDMGFSKSEIGLVAKHAGLWPAVIGGLLGGLWMVKLGINRALWVFGIVQLTAIFGFAWLAALGSHAVAGMPPVAASALQLVQLALVIGFEALGVGLGTAAFLAFIAHATNPRYTATQFALFTGLMALPRSLVNASAGYLVEQLGWFSFFLLCALLAVPGMLLLLRVAPWRGENA